VRFDGGIGQLHTWLVVNRWVIDLHDRLRLIEISATAIPHIASQFNSLDAVGWYASSYFLTQMAIQPAFGRLFDEFSPKMDFHTGDGNLRSRIHSMCLGAILVSAYRWSIDCRSRRSRTLCRYAHPDQPRSPYQEKALLSLSSNKYVWRCIVCWSFTGRRVH